jgi:alkylation response protein AidB-like acyl-CoA dehydrogenase
LHLLKELGRANLSLARIYEGHANAIHLIHAYGKTEQQVTAAIDCLSGRLFAIWNTDAAETVRLIRNSGGAWELKGTKAFASASRSAERPLVMAEKGSEGRQMCLLRKEEMTFLIDQTSWRPLGMEGTESYQIDVTGTQVDEAALIGNPNEYYAAPLFLGGSIRMSAVLLGGAEALFYYLRSYLHFVGQTNRPLQQMRMARVYAAIESGRGWLQFAAKEADAGLYRQVDSSVAQRMNFAANATRVAIEDICPQVIRLISESVGARGLMQPFRFSKVIRDLAMLLRQPDPDNNLLETGRYLLEQEGSNV